MKFTIPGRLPGLNDAINAARSDGRIENRLRKEYETAIGLIAKCAMKHRDLELPVTVHYTFYERNRRRDKDNIAGYAVKLIQDALVKSGVLPNDNWDAIAGYTLDWKVDKEDPRIVVEIESAVKANLYEEQERIYPCTVQILKNKMTGELSVGWWKGEEEPRLTE